MSDVLDIESQFGSEFGEDNEQLATLKLNAKSRKGRGFSQKASKKSALNKKVIFDNLDQPENYLQVNQRKSGIIPQKSVEGWTIFVTGVHEEATEEDLKDVFSEYGQITYFALNLDRRTGFIKGYAIIEYKTFEEASNTIENLNDIEFLGQSIKVSWAFVKKPLKPQRI